MPTNRTGRQKDWLPQLSNAPNCCYRQSELKGLWRTRRCVACSVAVAGQRTNQTERGCHLDDGDSTFIGEWEVTLLINNTLITKC